jgi:dolichol-phosphate mannosyltransferase
MDGACPGCFLSLVIPAYNEADGIARAVVEADDALRQLGWPYEVIVVDDGSRDATADAVRTAAHGRPNVRLLWHGTNRGYGAALRTGFEAARGERIAFTDADCQFHLADLARLVPLTETHAVAVGYRVDRQDPALRRFYSRGYNLLVRTLLGTRVRDVDCALKVFRRDALARILPEAHGFFVNSEMLTRARQQHLTVAEAGVRHRPRVLGRSTVSVRDIPRTLNALLPFWWSKVIFAGDREGPRRTANAPAAPVQLALFALLMLVACVLFLGRLHHPLLEPEEARYAEIPRQMLAEGELVTPVLHGEDYLQKPPLLYWLVMASYRTFGVHDWAARLVPALAGVLTVLVTSLWGWRACGFWPGLLGGAILCLSARFVYLAGILTMDGLLCLWVVAGLAAGHLALRDGSRRWGAIAACACALGVLTKGPVALVLVAAPLAVLPFLDRRCHAPSRARVAGFALIVGLIAGPWFAISAWLEPAAAGEFLWRHHVVRYLAPLDHEKPAWYYLPSLLAGALPWTLLAVPLVPYLARRTRRAGRRRPAALGVFLLALGWCVLFFSLSGCKRPGYILPAFPLLALVLATFLTHGLPWRRWLAAHGGRVQAAGGQLAHGLLRTALALGAVVACAAAGASLWSWGEAAAAMALLVAGLVVFRRAGAGEPAWRAWAWCGGTVATLLVIGTHALLPAYHERFGLRQQVVEQLDVARARGVSVACYPKRWDSVSFYLRRDVDVYTPRERRDLFDDVRTRGEVLLFVKRDGALSELLRTLPDGLVFEPRGEPGRNVVVGMLKMRAQ